MSESVFELHASICKALAHPKRLEILAALGGRELPAGEVVSRVGTTKGNISQHLAVMRQAGILAARRAGMNVYYRVSNPKIVQACALMREVLLDALDTRRAAAARSTGASREPARERSKRRRDTSKFDGRAGRPAMEASRSRMRHSLMRRRRRR